MPRKRAGRILAWSIFALLVLRGAVSLSAHRLDELLQASQVSITPAQITVVVYQTPGVEVAAPYLRDLDTNADAAISAEEGRAFAQRVIGQLVLDLDGSPLALSVEKSDYPDVPVMRSGEGSARIEARAAIPTLAVGRHVVAFTNNFDPGSGVYLANAMLPRDPEIAIVEQERSDQQKTLRIEFSVSETESRWAWWLALALLGVAGALVLSKASRSRQ